MGSAMLEITGLFLSVNGFICVILACSLPLWKVPAFQGANIVTAVQTWEGLWMNCVSQSTGELVCNTFDSVLILSEDLQVARALTTTAGVLATIGILVTIAGASWTKLINDVSRKARVISAGGFIFMVTGILQLIPVSWTANRIIKDFYNKSIPDNIKRELGPSLYIGMTAGVLFIAGSGLLWSSCCTSKAQRTHPAHYVRGQANYSQSHYV
ncbi:claudin-4-like [Heptranchias perlo]|uniref:claudin-4-like n=1 Tax=Heptranchias perlo TaxID=212740 RepID=UPI00355AA493